MNIEYKKTALDDNASIYDHSTDNKTEKEKLSEMNFKQKLEYFKNYYLAKTLGIIAIVAILFSVFYSIFSKGKEEILYVAVIDGTLAEEQTDTFMADFKEKIGFDEETQSIMIDDNFYFGNSMDYTYLQRFSTYCAVGQIDITVMPRSQFENYAANGFFSEVAEVLPTDLQVKLLNQMVEASLVDETGAVIEGSSKVYGIKISELPLYKGLSIDEDIILAFNVNSKHSETAVEFLRYLTK